MPKILKNRTWKQIILSLLLAIIVLAPEKVHAISSESLVTLTNSERIARQLPRLNKNDKLVASARQKAKHMCQQNYWAHVGPSGKTPWQFFREAGYAYLNAGENLAKGYQTDDEVMSAWMASQAHRDNIVHKQFSEIGIAQMNCRLTGSDVTLVVAHYAKPKPGVIKQYVVTTTSSVKISVSFYQNINKAHFLGWLVTKP